MPSWGRLVPFNSDRHQGPANGAWKLRASSVSVGRGAGCDVTVDWKYGSRLQFELEHDENTGDVYIVQQSSISETFLNGGGPYGDALPEGKRVLVSRDPANADYQQAGVPADAPIIFCNAPHLGYLCAAHGRTAGPPDPRRPGLTPEPARVHGRQRIKRKRTSKLTGETELYHPFASEYCGFTLVLERDLRAPPAPPTAEASGLPAASGREPPAAREPQPGPSATHQPVTHHPPPATHHPAAAPAAPAAAAARSAASAAAPAATPIPTPIRPHPLRPLPPPPPPSERSPTVAGMRSSAAVRRGARPQR